MSNIDNKTIISPSSKTSENNAELRQCVQKVLHNYLEDLGDYKPDNLYPLFIAEIEAPLLEAVLNYSKGNQSMAAKMLGMNRGTLRKKITQYNL